VEHAAATAGLLLLGLVAARSESIQTLGTADCEAAPCKPEAASVQLAAMYDQAFSAVSKAEPRYSGIGMVTSNRSDGSGTAFLVSACHVLTNYHVLYQTRRPDPYETFTFVYGVPDTAPAEFLAGVAATPVVLGTYYESARTCEDFALLELEACLGEEYRSVELLPLSLAGVQTLQSEAQGMGLGFSSAGYPDSEPWTHVSVDRTCTIDAAMHVSDREAYSTTCNSVQGSSGGPLFLELPDRDRLLVFGIIKGTAASYIPDDLQILAGDADNLGLRNRAVPISCIYDRIKDYVPGPR
jgi:V8-like Glu-specific endopeptidase